MASKIEWLARPGTKPETWNPVIGCSKVSAGCANCYAERMAGRLAAMGHGAYREVVCARPPIEWGPTCEWNGQVRWVESQRDKPFRWLAPRTVFVCSMGDIFHDDVRPAWQTEVWEVMNATRDHTYILLTKRAANMARRVPQLVRQFGVLPNVWLGVTIENMGNIGRIMELYRTDAAVRFISVEPMLSELPGLDYELDWLDWVICGGESGPGARPMALEWARGLRDQCVDAGVPFFFKQDGPKRGHLLDGREWRQWPKP